MRKGLFIYSSMALLLVLITQCKKKPFPDPNHGDPVFHFSGTVGSSSIKLEAGIDSFFLFTDYSQSSTGLYGFTGNMDRLDCTGCGPGLQIEFYDVQNRPIGVAVPPSDVVQTGGYGFVETATAPVTGKRLQFFADSTFIRAPTSFYWTFAIGGFVDTSSQSDPVITFPFNGVARVCLTVTDSLGTQSVLCNDVVVQDPPPTCNAFFSFDYVQQNSYRFFSDYGGPVTQHFWTYPDSTFDTVANPFKNFAVFYNPPFQVCHQVVDGNCVTSHCMLVDNPNSATHVLANFTYAPEQDTISQIMNRVHLRWTSPQGVEYSSYRVGGQPYGSTFTVGKVEGYDPNEDGEATRSFEFEVDAWLFNVGNPNDSIPLQGSGTYAVAYPD